jgi:hypothetical protein
MFNIRKLTFYTLCLVTILSSSCTKNFQDINTTPGLPSDITIGPLVNGVESTLPLRGQEQVSVHNDWYYPVTQLAATSGSSGYVLANGASDIWNDYYSALQNLNLALDKINASKGDVQDLNNTRAIVYILRAYKTFRVTDQFGDIPYFDAGKAYSGDASKYRPKYDAQQTIYDSLLTDLKWAVTNINTSISVSISSSDVLFGGNMSKWQAFANSLRLRHAMQMVEKDASTATAILSDVLSGSAPLIADGADVGLSPTLLPNGDKNWVRPWSFSSHKFVRISSTFWSMMADGTTTASIFDPRALLFAETNQAGAWAPYVIGSNASDNANPYNTGVRDVTINDKDNSLFSSFNYYLIRDQYYIPEFIMNSSEVHFLKAEAYERGLGVTQSSATAQAEYVAGITASVNFWYNIAHNTNTTNDDWAAVAPPPPTTAQMDALLANPKVALTGVAASDLNKIYAQEWVDAFRQPWLAFNLWRRTGSTPTIGIPTAYANFYRLPYPQIESVNNTDNYNTQISKIGSNTSAVKVWWMK